MNKCKRCKGVYLMECGVLCPTCSMPEPEGTLADFLKEYRRAEGSEARRMLNQYLFADDGIRAKG